MRRTRDSLALALLAASTLSSAISTAQPPPPAPPVSDTEAARKEGARQHFERGLVLFDEEAWDAALAEFLRSRAIFATRSATKNAAVCLRKLKRYDEAVEMFEALLATPGVPPADRDLAQREIATLRGLLGAVELQEAPPGATVLIDGRDRGTTGAGPLRVGVGSHVVRVYKDGYDAFEVRVEVAGGESKPVVVRLTRLAQSGRLQVVEAGGKIFDVVVDNVVVGKTPWEGSLAIGDHAVFLRGDHLGTQPSSVAVRLNQITPLSLASEELASELRVQPTPTGATVALDGVSLGNGVWDGRLRAGAHRIEVIAEGFIPQVRDVRLEPGKHDVIDVTLERDPTSSIWRDTRGRFYIEADGAFALAPTLGGEACGSPCSSGLGLGFLALGRGGYRFSSGFMLGIDAGYLQVAQKLNARHTTVTPMGLEPNPGTADDAFTLRGGLVGGSAGIRLGSRFPFTLRLGTGVFIGSLGDHRTGNFQTVARPGNPVASYSVDVSESPSLTALYLAPEARIGAKIGDHFELSLGVAAVVLLVFSPPAWSPLDAPVAASTSGQATFDADALTSKAVVAIVPGLGARYEF